MNIKSNLKYFIAGVAIVSLSVLSTGCKRWSDRTPDEKVSYVSDKVERKLDLNQSQRKDLEPLVSELVELGTYFKGQKSRTLSAFQKQWDSDKFNQEDLDKIVAEISAEFNTRIKTAFGKLSTFHGKLDQGQKTKVSKMISKHQDSHH